MTVNQIDRRSFFRTSGMALGGLALAQGGLQALAGPAQAWKTPPGYGPLSPVADENTGLPLIMLPDGFRYVSFGWTRDPMDDGVLTPPAHDGMAVVDAGHSRLVLVRNHEVRGRAAAYTPNRSITYDPSAGGGTTNLTFDIRQGQWHDAWSSLAGTSTNCAGGATYAKSWLTCEETLDVYDKLHGWVFEVPAARQAVPAPLKAMGRFVHEAVAVDRQSGIIYETEDRGTAGFYRFLPADKNRLDKGGRLQMLKVVGTYQADLRGSVGVGSTFRVEWVDIHDPGPIAPGHRTASVSSARASTRAAPFSPGSRARRTTRRISACTSCRRTAARPARGRSGSTIRATSSSVSSSSHRMERSWTIPTISGRARPATSCCARTVI